MFKTPMQRIAGVEKGKEEPGHVSGRASNASGEVKKSVTVSKHHDGHYSVSQHGGGEAVHVPASEDAVNHIFTALDYDEDDMGAADQETQQKSSGGGTTTSKKA